MRVRIVTFPCGSTDPHTPQMYLEQTTLVCLHLTLFPLEYAIVFSYSLINADFFTSEIGSDILMNVLQDYVNLISLHGKILPRYSEIDKFKIKKT